jgi:hypothetical protein
VSDNVIADASWRAPVFLRVGYGASEAVASPHQALDYLCHRWPFERGTHYTNALQCCGSAADGQVPAETAKEAFIAAAVEARLIS